MTPVRPRLEYSARPFEVTRVKSIPKKASTK